MASLASIDLSSIEGRYDWLREQAVSRRDIALGDGRSVAGEMLAALAKQGPDVGDDLRLGVQLLADRSAAPDFEAWQRRNFDKPRGALPWALSVERVETNTAPAVSVWHNARNQAWNAVPLAALGQRASPILGLARYDGTVTANMLLSYPSVWGWLWNAFFSTTGPAGINYGDIVYAEEMANILKEANATFGQASFTDEDTVFFAAPGVCLWLGRMGGEWRSDLVVDHVDQVERLSRGFLEALRVPRRRVELAKNRVVR